MAKIRIHELAKQINVENSQIIKVLQDAGVEVKSHMSSIEDKDIELVKKKLGISGAAVSSDTATKEEKTKKAVEKKAEEKVDDKKEVKAEEKAADAKVESADDVDQILQCLLFFFVFNLLHS